MFDADYFYSIFKHMRCLLTAVHIPDIIDDLTNKIDQEIISTELDYTLRPDLDFVLAKITALLHDYDSGGLAINEQEALGFALSLQFEMSVLYFDFLRLVLDGSREHRKNRKKILGDLIKNLEECLPSQQESIRFIFLGERPDSEVLVPKLIKLPSMNFVGKSVPPATHEDLLVWCSLPHDDKTFKPLQRMRHLKILLTEIRDSMPDSISVFYNMHWLHTAMLGVYALSHTLLENDVYEVLCSDAELRGKYLQTYRSYDSEQFIEFRDRGIMKEPEIAPVVASTKYS